MFYSQCSGKTGPPREVMRWLQTLQLSTYPKNACRDFSNGYLVAEIFSHYYPKDFPLHSFDKGSSLPAKQRNWSQIKRSLQKHDLYLMKEAIDGTIHCKPGAAELLVQEVYGVLTSQSIIDVQIPDFTDEEYQKLLPTVARSTASVAIKNNLKTTEIKAAPDIRTNQRKAEVILHRHLEHKAAERILTSACFKGKLDQAKHSPPQGKGNECFNGPSSGGTTSNLWSSGTWGGALVSFKEIKVRQPAKGLLVKQ
ncbi:spermatogenesis-associated protein 4 [Pholidichthys leucotaenia]